MTDKLNMSLSLDLDNKWSYLRTYGNEAWREFPSYLDLVVPRILAFFADRDIRITFFVVGKDAALDRNRAAIASLSAAGHEIGNHSYFHEPWLHLYSAQDLDRDLQMAEEAIQEVTGVRVNGFRGPGYSLTETTLTVLSKRGYKYDATAFPNILNPLSRAYLFATTNLSKDEKKKRKALFGSFADALRPVKPYRWQLNEGFLPELPVTTMPFFKVPIHFSYLLYLATYSTHLAHLYLRLSIGMCRLTQTEPSLLMHPLDFMGKEDDDDLASFPAMGLPLVRKMELMSMFFVQLLRSFEPLTMGEHVDRILKNQPLRNYRPKFSR
jgi:peptidoglycan/xylan/chitin deacetylase (PgdA/CDA1 family)